MINRKVACRVLQSLGIECEVASNGQEAVDAVAEMMEGARGASETSTSNNNNGGCGNKKIDVVLMDMCMPVMNGVEATKAIRNLGCLIPIVAMTANAEDKDKEQCLAAGMNGFLSKPVLREQLAGCIMEAKCSSDVDGGGGGSDGGSDVNNNNNNNTC
jgi:CheY-like chemotaxis protein